MNKISISLVIATLLVTGCSDKPKEQESASVETVKEQTASSAQGLYGVSSEESNSGAQNVPAESYHVATILETMNAANYTYARVSEKGNEYWIAGPQTDVKVGTNISFVEQMVMQQFTSKALNRTFDSLVFATTIIPVDKSGKAASKGKDHNCGSCDSDVKPSDKATASQTAAQAHASASTNDTQAEAIKVAKNSKGYTIEELYAKSAKLKSKSVKVNAKVVKVSKNIMGKDWIHLQDGTGSKGTNDLIATAKTSTVKVGDVVTTVATLNTDVDFGYGYFFTVILENSTFTAAK